MQYLQYGENMVKLLVKIHIWRPLHPCIIFISLCQNPHTSSLNSCNDLIFTDEPNLVVNSCTQPSLNFKYHHEIIYRTSNLSIEDLQKSK